MPDAEIHWPSSEASPYAGQVWAVEVELTPKPAGRTTRIMTELLSPMRYAQVVYLTAPAARSVVARAVASLQAGQAVPARGPRPARVRVHPGAAVISVLSWIMLTVCGTGSRPPPTAASG